MVIVDLVARMVMKREAEGGEDGDGEDCSSGGGGGCRAAVMMMMEKETVR